MLMLLVSLPLTLTAQENGRDRRPGSNRRRGSEDVSLLLISSGDVQRELDITPAQGELLEAIGEDLSSQRRGSYSRAERTRRAELPKRLFRVVLDEDQSDRLAQIGLQFKGPFAIEDDKFAEAVAISDDQLAAVRRARSKQVELSSARLRELVGNSAAEKWKSQLGENFNFRGRLGRLRSAYLVDRQRADRRRRSDGN